MTVGMEKVREFYNAFLTEEEMALIDNSRHKIIFDTLRTFFCKPGRVLDIGCGTGQTSRFLHSIGHTVTAIDLSPKRIELAGKHQPDTGHIDYIAADVTKWESKKKFDYVVMADVLEHIRPEDLCGLFRVLHDNTCRDAKIYLNVPDGALLRFLHRKLPKVLQIIDEPYSVGDVLYLFEGINFVPMYMRLYGTQYCEYVFYRKWYRNSLYKRTYGIKD